EFSIRAKGGVRLNTDTMLIFGNSSASLLSGDQGGAIELGDSLSTNATPYLDFHFGIGVTEDYNTRIIADGPQQLTIERSGSAVPLARFFPGGLEVNGTLCCTSDRNQKENFEPVDPGAVLAKVSALPLAQWSYKEDTHCTHIGPMAQDFYAAFGF